MWRADHLLPSLFFVLLFASRPVLLIDLCFHLSWTVPQPQKQNKPRRLHVFILEEQDGQHGVHVFIHVSRWGPLLTHLC